jgi:hypothetical protein
MVDEKREMKNGKKHSLFFVDAMFNWLIMSKHESKKRIVQKNVDIRSNTLNPLYKVSTLSPMCPRRPNRV